jgi:uncharacterized paraquat-inducible protein A
MDLGRLIERQLLAVPCQHCEAQWALSVKELRSATTAACPTCHATTRLDTSHIHERIYAITRAMVQLDHRLLEASLQAINESLDRQGATELRLLRIC